MTVIWLNIRSLTYWSGSQLYSLGELCGLLPGDKPTSSQLHLMVTLSAGMGDSSPAVGKLKDALAGHDAFQQCYLVSHLCRRDFYI